MAQSIVDVLQEDIGKLTAKRAQKLTSKEIERLATSVNDFYEGWDAPDLASDEMRFYSGGWIASNFPAEANQKYLHTSLAYAPTVVIHDPIAEWFDPARDQLESLPRIPSARRNPNGRPAVEIQSSEAHLRKMDGYYAFEDDRDERTRAFLATVLPAMDRFAPLIQSGAVLAIPELRLLRQYQQGMLSAVRNDARDEALAKLIRELIAQGDPPARSNVIRGADITFPGGFAKGHKTRALVQDAAYYFNKTLAISDALSARYVPPAGSDSALWEYRLTQLGHGLDTKTKHKVELRLLPGLAAAELPFLQDLDAKLLLAIRQDIPEFEAWRTELRKIIRVVESLPSEGSVFESEARDVLQDELIPRAEAVRRAVSTSAALRRATKESTAELGITGAAIGYASVATGTRASALAIVMASIAAPLRIAYKVAFGGAPTEANAVLAQLVRRK